MTDLNALLKDFFDKRLSYKQINREAHEALLKGIVEEIEALKAGSPPGPIFAKDMGAYTAELKVPIEPKRGPGRPPKAEAA